MTRASAAARLVLLVLGLALLAIVASRPAAALKATPVSPDLDRIELTTVGQFYQGRGDSLQIATAPDQDGVTGRMAVKATASGTNPDWLVFALTNPTPRTIERWLTAERYNVVSSGVVWPDLDVRRIEAVTPSVGYLPERVKSDRADIFKITLEPGQTITYVAELTPGRLARVYLWKPLDYELKARDRQLFNGIMIGIVGLLGIFLTAVFAANHKAIFPSAALVSWCVLAYLCVDFGFWHKLFQLRAEDTAVHRAATEAAMAASLVVFLHAFLRIGSWHGFIRMLWTVWTVAQLALIAVAVVDPRLAATFARASFVAIAGIGALVMLFLALRGQDRALSLIPTWIMLMVWVFAAGLTLTGRLGGEVVISGLVAGLVLTVVLLGFTVTQFAFRSVEPLYGATPSEQQLRSLAVDGAGAAVFEWQAKRKEIKTSPVVEQSLGLRPGDLSTKVEDFIRYVHPTDRERFQLMLWSTEERGGGPMRLDFRMRHSDGSYRWFNLEAHSVPGMERRAVRSVGLIRDVTEQRRATERLMHDAVHDNLTGLPNRALFLDRLATAFARARTEAGVRPTVMFIDIDKFKSVNSSFGLIVGDSLLLTVSRRLSKHLAPLDTLARVSGDQFAMLTLADKNPRELAVIAEQVRRSLRAPIRIAGQDIVLTASIGLSVFDGQQQEAADLLKEAEIAMYRAKRGGADRIEIFTPEMRGERDDRIAIESDLRRAIEKRQIRVLYQPIISLATEQLAGFEALVRWEHPKLGLLNPAEFVPVAEESDLIVKLGSVVLDKAVTDAARWQKELPRVSDQLFVSVNVSSRQLFRPEFVQEVRQLLGRAVIPPGSLRLEVTESLVMENAEHAAEVLEWLRSAGAGLSLDDFGTGYSSLAYLQTFPFDTIKIDRAIVQAGLAEGTGSPIVRSIVALAHELGKKVVAEGVETASDVGFLRSLGCEMAQGFYYGEPMPERDVLQLLKVIRKSERKLQRRGFFRTKTRSQPQPAPRAAAAAAAAATTDRSGAAANGSVPGKRLAAAVAGGQARIRPRSPQQLIRPTDPQAQAAPPMRPNMPPTGREAMPTAPPVQPVPPYQPPPQASQPAAVLQPVAAVLDTLAQPLAPPQQVVPPPAYTPPQVPAAPAPQPPPPPPPPPPSLAPSVRRAFEPPRETTRRPTAPPIQVQPRPRPAPVVGDGVVGRNLPPAMSASLARLAGKTSGTATVPPTAPATKPPKSEG